MNIFYQGTDITEMIQINVCIVRDTATDRADSLELEFGNAAKWYSWGPQEDDQIYVTHDGYDSGIMFVNKVLPEDDKYRILATSIPCSARNKINKSFYGKTIEQIMQACAITDNMDYALYGVNGKTVIPYIERVNEGSAAFLYRLLKLESAVFKCINGKYTAIGLQYAQNQNAGQTMEILAGQDGVRYRRDGTVYQFCTIKTPYANTSAEDTLYSNGQRMNISYLPVLDDIQAGRWARGTLIETNRKCETLVIQNTFNPGLTAMARMDIEGNTDATGQWIVEEVSHDLINLTTTATLRRCIWTVR